MQNPTIHLHNFKIEKIPPPKKKKQQKTKQNKKYSPKKYLRNIDAFIYRKKV